jgi:hypothetical protein
MTINVIIRGFLEFLVLKINHSTFDRKVLETLDNISVKKRKNIQLKKAFKDKLPSKEEKQ